MSIHNHETDHKRVPTHHKHHKRSNHKKNLLIHFHPVSWSSIRNTIYDATYINNHNQIDQINGLMCKLCQNQGVIIWKQNNQNHIEIRKKTLGVKSVLFQGGVFFLIASRCWNNNAMRNTRFSNHRYPRNSFHWISQISVILITKITINNFISSWCIIFL